MDKLYLNNDGSDLICFIGESKATAVRFPAHRGVLMVISPTFEAMLTNNKFVESASGEVLITDITPNAFNALLFFAYTRRLKSQRISELFDTLYVAQKYFVDDLRSYCFQHLAAKTISDGNFWSFFSIVHYYSCEQMPVEIILRTKKFLNANTTNLLQHADFENLSQYLLNAVVENDFLRAENELEIFNSIIRWAKVECCRQKLDVNPRNERYVLGDIIYKIRFLSMSRDDLRNGPIKSEILTIEEGEMLLEKQINNSAELPPPWRTLLRTVPRTRLLQGNQVWHLSESVDSDLPNQFQHSALLVSANNVVFKTVTVLIIPNYPKVNLICNLSDLHGRLIKEWNFTKNFDISTVYDSKVPVVIEEPIFLKAFTCYKFKVYCETGRLSSSRFNNTVLCSDSNLQEIFCVMGCSDKSNEEFKSSEFWQRNFGSIEKSQYFQNLNTTGIIKGISIELL